MAQEQGYTDSQECYLADLYYVGTDHYVADVGTRAENVTIEDVGPKSRYENGDPWMKLDIEEIIEQEILKPALDLKPVPKERDNEF